MKTFKFSLVLRTRENTDSFITLDDNIYGIYSKRVNILYLLLIPIITRNHYHSLDRFNRLQMDDTFLIYTGNRL